MDAEQLRLFIERFIEPYTAMPLLGVGGFCADRPLRVEVRYDGVAATVIAPTDAPTGSPFPHHFSAHLPVESDVVRVTVVAVFESNETMWFDGPFAAITERGTAETPPSKFTAKNLLSPRRWFGRVRRMAETARMLKSKVEFRLLKRRFPHRDVHDAYVEATALTPLVRSGLEAEIAGFTYRPTVSILCPVYNVDTKWLRRAVESVRSQLYGRWELCLADDASTNPATVQYLRLLVGTDPRIKVTFRETNGHICAATNSAAESATGEFVALMDNDDELSPDALARIVAALQTNRNADLIYSDEDKIDAAGKRYDPQFKPDWSPELLLSYNYVNHFTVMRRSLFEAVGRFREGFEGSQDHDLLLRLTERSDRVVHIPHILYHWRSLPSSTASAAGVKQYVHTAGRRAVAEALQRWGVNATLTVPAFAERLGLPVLSLDGPDVGPRVSVVIRGHGAEITETAIRERTDYRNVAIIRDVTEADGEFVLFLRDGLVPEDKRWLSRLVANLQLPGVGAVGGTIRDEAGRIVLAGLVDASNEGGGFVPAFAGLPADAVSYYFYAEVTRNVAAVGGECILVRRELINYRDEETVDFYALMKDRGLRCLHVGDVSLRGRPSPLTPLSAIDESRRQSRFTDSSGERGTKPKPRPDPYHNANCSTRAPFTPVGDSPLLPTGPAIKAFVLAHNLAAAEGAPRYLSDIVVGLKNRGSLSPTVASCSGGVGEMVYREAGIPVSILGRSWGTRLIDGLWTRREYESAVAELVAELKRARPELVVGNTLLTFPVIEAAARLGIPSVWVIHESYSAEVMARLFTPFAKARCEAAFAVATRVVPCSHDTASLFERLDVRKVVRVRHNALDPAEIDRYVGRVSKAEAAGQTPGPPHHTRFVSVGTVCERKGQHTLVEAAARLAKERSDFAVHLVGARPGIPYLEYVRHLIRRNDLGNIVHLIPEADARPYFRAADAFVCTSHMETYSRSVLEAEAFGLPILSTPCCGVGEQVTWGVNAWEFAVGDAAGLAGHMRTLIIDPALRASMAAASRNRFDAHPPFDAMLDSFAHVFRVAANLGPWGQTTIESKPALRKAA
jgi:glycosyltransferase involved in cell wall biosynthesis